MPYRTEWVDPEVLLEHAGVTVYWTYNDDDIDAPLFDWYTTSQEIEDFRDDVDVRE